MVAFCLLCYYYLRSLHFQCTYTWLLDKCQCFYHLYPSAFTYSVLRCKIDVDYSLILSDLCACYVYWGLLVSYKQSNSCLNATDFSLNIWIYLAHYFPQHGNVSSVLPAFLGFLGSSIFVPQKFLVDAGGGTRSRQKMVSWVGSRSMQPKSCFRDGTVAEGNHTALWNIC
jgi:hypothetical protein